LFASLAVYGRIDQQRGVLLTHRSPLIYTLWLMHRGALFLCRRTFSAEAFFPAAAAAAEMRYPADLCNRRPHVCCCFIFLIKSDAFWQTAFLLLILPESSCKIVM